MKLTAFQMMEEIDAAESKVSELRTKYLRKSGWNYTSNTPGCVWMWLKEIDGRTFMCDSDDADRFQRELDYIEMNKEHEEALDADALSCIVCGAIRGEPDNPHKQRGDIHHGDKHG